jgi:poly-gamma-glutamate synthesis protein (capsule biosynthesis protein)
VDLLLARGDGLDRVFGDTLPVLQGFDVLLGNLEGAATRRGQKATKSFTFRFDPGALARLSEAGFTWLSLTNNHSFDFGLEGFLDTLDALAAAGIGTSGAGRSEEDARQASKAEAGSTPVRIVSFAAYPVDRTGFDGRRVARAAGQRPGILWLDDPSIAAAARAFGPGSFDIAVVHGGEEWSRGPTPQLRELCGKLAAAGADLVVGSHPHVLHPVEEVNGALVAWSLGNFVFPGMDGTPGGEDSAILRVGLHGGATRYVQLIPVRLKGTGVRLGVSRAGPAGVTLADTGKGDTR